MLWRAGVLWQSVALRKHIDPICKSVPNCPTASPESWKSQNWLASEHFQNSPKNRYTVLWPVML